MLPYMRNLCLLTKQSITYRLLARKDKRNPALDLYKKINFTDAVSYYVCLTEINNKLVNTIGDIGEKSRTWRCCRLSQDYCWLSLRFFSASITLISFNSLAEFLRRNSNLHVLCEINEHNRDPWRHTPCAHVHIH